MSSPVRTLAILGSTGSVGRQCLQVVEELRERFVVAALAAGKNIEQLAGQVARFQPELVAIATAEILPASAASAFALLYIGVPFAFLLDLFAGHGYRIVLCLFLLVWVGDSAAYFVGRALGRHKLAPVLSPGKTVEGTAASLAATVAVGYWLLPAWFGLNAAHAFLLPVIVNVAAQLGDLAESALKRSAGVKDSSTLLPGHGGVLDRVDSLLFAAPALWYYWNLLVRGSF